MRHSEPLYCVKKEFRDHLNRTRFGWPLHKVVTPWARKYFGTAWASGTYSRMRQGHPATEETIQKLISYIKIGDDSSPDLPECRAIWNEYLCGKTNKNLASLSTGEILHVICEPATSASIVTTVRDELMHALDMVGDFIKVAWQPRRFVKHCQSPEHVQMAVRWVYIQAARLNTNPELPASEAIRVAESDVLKLPMSKYLDQAIEWWKFNPWTVLFAADRGTRIGVCINLPVNDEAYIRARLGTPATELCAKADLLSTSPQLIVEALAMRPREIATSVQNPTRCMLIAFVCQQAWLTRVDGLAKSVPMRLLAVGGTPENCDRLLAAKYKPTGTKMARTGVDLYERSLSLERKLQKDYAVYVQWRGLQSLLAYSKTPEG